MVTEVDHLSEALILGAIREAFPADGVLAEESGIGVGTSDRVWVVDPLDGTINYANGIPIFCVAIGLVVDGRPSVGAGRDPVRGVTFAASADGPALSNGRPIRASARAPVRLRHLLTIDGPRLSDRLAAIRQAIGSPAGTARPRSPSPASRTAGSTASPRPTGCPPGTWRHPG